MDRHKLTEEDRNEIERLLGDIAGRFKDSECPAFVEAAPLLAHGLPQALRQDVERFRQERLSGTLLISGLRVAEARIGRTPGHWRDRPTPSPTLKEECLLLLIASLLGDPFCWATQQDGNLIHDVVPTKGHEHEQLGSSSEEILAWHTEDAFHPCRGDYLLLGCLRNPGRVATTVGEIGDVELSDGVKRVLFDKRFTIAPDESHLPHNNSNSTEAEFSKIERWRTQPQKVAVLWGDPERPYVRADPFFMGVEPGDTEAAEALEKFVEAVDRQLQDVILEGTDFLVIDNFRSVHGRRSFTARNDGSDRWLKRVNVTRDLRKSCEWRSEALSRTIT